MREFLRENAIGTAIMLVLMLTIIGLICGGIHSDYRKAQTVVACLAAGWPASDCALLGR